MQQSQQQINSAGVKVNEVHPQPLTSVGKFQSVPLSVMSFLHSRVAVALGIFHPRTVSCGLGW